MKSKDLFKKKKKKKLWSLLLQILLGSLRVDIFYYNCPKYIWCGMQEKGPYAIRRQCMSRSVCTSVQSNLGIFHSSTYTTVPTNSVSGQWRPRSACAYAQADQGLPCLQLTYGPFSLIRHHKGSHIHVNFKGYLYISSIMYLLQVLPRKLAKLSNKFNPLNALKCQENLHLKMSSVFVVCWIFLQTFQTYFCMQANNVDLDQTAPKGAVWSGSTHFAMTFKITSRWQSRRQVL